MIVIHRQIRGIIAVGLILAVIPFFRFYCPAHYDYQGPIFSESNQHAIAVEIDTNSGTRGIYFTEPSMTLNNLLRNLRLATVFNGDFHLEDGMAVRLTDQGDNTGFELKKISARQRMALGMPMDVNLASLNELMMIPGVGEAMAQKILTRRREIGGFKSLDGLMEVSGIKEKNLLKLSKYLFVEKKPQ